MLLSNIEKILEKNEFTCTHLSAKERPPHDRLLVFLGLDSKKREKLLEIIAIQHPDSSESVSYSPSPFATRIQFRFDCPFHVQDIALNQMASLLHFLNQLIDLPGFELDELNGKVIYRHVWIMNPSMIDPLLIMNILDAIMLNIALFYDSIESVADHTLTFNNILSQIIQITEHSKSYRY